jgi:hypothetical protein
VVKLDADVSMGPDYFERLLARFDADPALGIASGLCLEEEQGEWRPRYVVRGHVRGASRVWRWTCFEAIRPLETRLGWDEIDELKANVLGWKTTTFNDLVFRHHRQVAQRDGAQRLRWQENGQRAHYMGYRFSYMLLRCLHHARRDPSALWMIASYLRAALRRRPQYPDVEVRRFLRRQQSARYLGVRAREARGKRAA